jgi:glutamine amidotransferase
MGNLRSVERAVRYLGFYPEVRSDVGVPSHLILPGVGAFGAAMRRLKPLEPDIVAFAAAGGPLLGICLGQQLLMQQSEELGDHRGLGLVPGRVRYLPRTPNIKVPHMGWNDLEPQTSWPGSAAQGRQVFFVHSLYTDCDSAADVASWTHHGLRFPSAIRKDNIWGCQFHPEKSGEAGLDILREFLSC